MVEEMDRLPDWAFTETELDDMAKDVLEPANTVGLKHLALYELYKDEKATGILMILATESISDGLHAINRVWGEIGLYAEIWEFNETPSERSAIKLTQLLLGLENIQYVPKVRLAGWKNMIYKKEWVKELI